MKRDCLIFSLSWSGQQSLEGVTLILKGNDHFKQAVDKYWHEWLRKP